MLDNFDGPDVIRETIYTGRRGLYFPLFGKIIYGIIKILGTFRKGFLEMIKKIFPTFKKSFFFV